MVKVRVETCCCGLSLRVGAFICIFIFYLMAFVALFLYLSIQRNELGHYRIWGCLGAMDGLDDKNKVLCVLINEDDEPVDPDLTEAPEPVDESVNMPQVNLQQLTVKHRSMFNKGMRLLDIKGLVIAILCLVFSLIGVLGILFKKPLLILIFIIFGCCMIIIDTVLSIVALVYLFQTTVKTVTIIGICYVAYTILWIFVALYCLVVCDSYRHQLKEEIEEENEEGRRASVKGKTEAPK